MKSSVESEWRRDSIAAGMDGHVKTVALGWKCECGSQIGPDATMMKCYGCQGLRDGKLDPPREQARQNTLTKNTCSWT